MALGPAPVTVMGLDRGSKEVDDPVARKEDAMTLKPGTTVDDTRRLESGMTRSEIVALFKRRQDAWEDLDAKTLAQDYTDETVIDSPSAGVHTGRDAEKALGAMFDAFRDLTMPVDDLVIDGDIVVAILSFEGTHMRPLLGFEPTGKRFHFSAGVVPRRTEATTSH